jgi:Doublecortin
VYQNGDSHHAGVKVLVGRGCNTFDKLLLKITKGLTISTGACKKIYRVSQAAEGNTHKRVTSLDDIEDGGIYLGCGPEPISKTKYPSALMI